MREIEVYKLDREAISAVQDMAIAEKDVMQRIKKTQIEYEDLIKRQQALLTALLTKHNALNPHSYGIDSTGEYFVIESTKVITG